MIEIIQVVLILAVLYLLMSKKNIFSSDKNPGVLLDSSTIIDGRILDVASAGFIPGRLIIPRFIVNELQMLADGNDAHKRERARFGLDLIQQLQTEIPKMKIINYKVKSMATDDKLMETAVKYNMMICTNDFNLNKVAVIGGIKILNINELAQAVRPSALPGEKYIVKIIQKGSNKDQGVGYLEDGTMVVVAGAGRRIGKKVEINVTRMLQTEAGKMIFAKLVQSQNRISK